MPDGKTVVKRAEPVGTVKYAREIAALAVNAGRCAWECGGNIRHVKCITPQTWVAGAWGRVDSTIGDVYESWKEAKVGQIAINGREGHGSNNIESEGRRGRYGHAIRRLV